jgi:hypothetical protein
MDRYFIPAQSLHLKSSVFSFHLLLSGGLFHPSHCFFGSWCSLKFDTHLVVFYDLKQHVSDIFALRKDIIIKCWVYFPQCCWRCYFATFRKTHSNGPTSKILSQTTLKATPLAQNINALSKEKSILWFSNRPIDSRKLMPTMICPIYKVRDSCPV